MAFVSRIGRAIALFGSLLSGAAATDKAPDDEPDDAKKDDQETPKSDSAGPARESLIAAAERIRSTSRWIVGGFAAVAAVVVGTAPLDKLGELDVGGWRFWVAAVALLAVLVGIVLVIRQAASVDAPVGASPEQLKRAENHLARVPPPLARDYTEMQAAAAFIAAADLVDVRDLSRRRTMPERYVKAEDWPITFLANERDTARDRWLYAQLRVEEEEDPKERARLEERNAGRAARLKRLDGELTYVVTVANYFRLSRRFDQRKKWIVRGAVLAAVGIVAFKYAASSEDDEAPAPKLDGVTLTRAVGVDFEAASLAGARLAGADLRRAKLASADLTAADLARANLEDADLTGANLSAATLLGADGLEPADVKGATWIGATCPDGFEIDDVADTCATDERLDGSAE